MLALGYVEWVRRDRDTGGRHDGAVEGSRGEGASQEVECSSVRHVFPGQNQPLLGHIISHQTPGKLTNTQPPFHRSHLLLIYIV